MIPEIFYWRTAKWTNVIALFNPAFEALSMKIMPLITAQLCYHILWFIVNQAYHTVGFVREFVRVVLNTAQGRQDAGDLGVGQRRAALKLLA